MADGITIVTDFGFDETDLQRLREAAGPASRIMQVGNLAAMRLALQSAEVLCSFRPPPDLLALAPRLQWLQYPGAGIDTLLRDGLVRKGQSLQITTVSSANANSIAEYVFGAMIIFARKWDEMLRLQHQGKWASGQSWGALRGVTLEGQTLGIVGLGAIGRRVAQLGRAFGMRILGMRRTARAGEADPDCAAIFSVDQLPALLGESDFVLLSVPLTPQTTNLIGPRELQAMRSNAFLINVARGEVIDEPALIRALRERRIAGAALDVVASEPLMSASPLWNLPGVLITPHLSGLTTGYSHRVADHFATNIRRFLAGEELIDLVDPETGYGKPHARQ